MGGGTRRGNNYTLDGVSITDLTNRAVANPTIEALDDVKVQVHTYDAEMGRTGGGVFNTTLRSGSNDYRGTGYVDGGRKQISGWLYQALLDNMPYDRFVRELINPTPASEGFIAGIKWRGRINASQVPEIQFSQNISQVFLGINMKCASCHDSFIDSWKLDDAYSLAAVITDRPLEIHRCDKPTGRKAVPGFLFPKLGTIDAKRHTECAYYNDARSLFTKPIPLRLRCPPMRSVTHSTRLDLHEYATRSIH